MSVSDVAEQTRITAHHLASIESGDYSGLPGGIFNKGFVRSFAKCVGVDEDEALNDYLASTASASPVDREELYSPAVFTDGSDRGGKTASLLLAAAVIVILAGGLGGFLYYILADEPEVESQPVRLTAEVSESVPQPSTAAPEKLEMKVSVRAGESAVDFYYEADGGTKKRMLLAPGEALELEPEFSIRFSFYRTIVPHVILAIDGKPVELPEPRRNTLEVLVNRQNFEDLVSSGRYEITEDSPASEPAGQRAESDDPGRGDSVSGTAVGANRFESTERPRGTNRVENGSANRQSPPRNRPAASPSPSR
jgi:cytoskeletal protein RodZ